MLKGVGYAICVIDVYVGMFYNTVIGWAVYYFISSIVSAGQVSSTVIQYRHFLYDFFTQTERFWDIQNTNRSQQKKILFSWLKFTNITISEIFSKF